LFRAKTGEERDAWASCIESITNVLSDQNESDLMETDNFNMAAYIPHQLIPKKKPTLSDFQVIKVVGRGTFGNVLLVYKKDDPKQTRMALKLISKKVIRQKVKFIYSG
jgi:serine/threonine protein kinase